MRYPALLDNRRKLSYHKPMLTKLKQNAKSNLKIKSLIYLAVVGVLILVDLLTKYYEEKDGWNFNVIRKFIEVRSGSRNPGCAFSFLAEAAWGQTFLIVLTFIMLFVILAVFFILPERFIIFKVSLSLIFGGAIGNLVDRIAFREVRDFVDINMFGNMVSCNFADFWIVFGTVLAVIDILFINAWAVLPLTTSAKEAQRKNRNKRAKTRKQMEIKKFCAEENFPRLDLFLSEMLEGKTRSAIKKLIEGGNVLLNGNSAKPSQSILKGDIAEVTLPDAVEIRARAEDIPIDIIYEDDDLAVINKPQGMTVHMGNGQIDGTLVNALLFRLKTLSGINGEIRPGIVHRIDKNTSGLLVVAKNDRAHLSLSEQIAEKTCKRTYLALLEGNLKEDFGEVTTYIGRSPSDRLKMAVVPPEKGKIAITDFKVVKRYEGYTLCRFDLKTGRTHQIRVHAKYLGHPIVGDDIYGIKKQKFKLNGQLLHAYRLEFKHPTSKKEMSFEAPLPDYFTETLNKLTEI